jgi:uncharacterized membrane protein YqiK
MNNICGKRENPENIIESRGARQQQATTADHALADLLPD